MYGMFAIRDATGVAAGLASQPQDKRLIFQGPARLPLCGALLLDRAMSEPLTGRVSQAGNRWKPHSDPYHLLGQTCDFWHQLTLV